MQQLDQEEKQLGGKSFISEALGSHLMGLKENELNDTRLLYLKRNGYNASKLSVAYQKQQELIEQHKEAFVKEMNPPIEEHIPPMINSMLNPLMIDIFTSEEELGKYILDKII
ncbi:MULTISPECIES: hypothetical protein [Flammeovirga]|uniref:Uncharacterized protein n=1 Tax=Flammeovirga agarivorans TaxID=2726742 RepID=A0A7X8SJJ4_9BACT|nr:MULTISPECIES: hypothetical protein [Flammeovirga]NLR91317.1 hypothetical protein [Flammeovirga agarivorans]